MSPPAHGRSAPRADISVPDDPDEIYDLVMERGWGDGLPVIPPTDARVDKMLRFTDRDPTEVLGTVPPGRGEATIHKVAVNAVMAGCRPEYLPVVITAVECLLDPRLNVYALQATTNPVAVAGFVNGPCREGLGFNARDNCLGPGNRANATVGRALHLVMLNVGGARPGELDRACHGSPGKFTFFFAENEEESPWDPFHVHEGYDPDVSTVTVFGATGTTNFLEPTGDADDLLRVFARSMAFPTSNDYITNGDPFLVFSVEHAVYLARAGYDRRAVQQALWEQARLRLSDFTQANIDSWVSSAWTPVFGELTPDTLVPFGSTPEKLRIVVAGGDSHHTAYLPSFGNTMPITRAITDALGNPMEAWGRPVD